MGKPEGPDITEGPDVTVGPDVMDMTKGRLKKGKLEKEEHKEGREGGRED